MIKNLMQGLVNESAMITGHESGIFLENGIITACSDLMQVGTVHPHTASVLNHPGISFFLGDSTYHKLILRDKTECILYIASTCEHNLKSLAFMAMGVMNMKTFYDEKFSKTAFLKNLIQGGLQSNEFSGRAKELHISYSVPRTVYFIKVSGIREGDPYEVILSMFPNKVKDFVIKIDDDETVLIKELRTKTYENEILLDAKTITDTVNSELMIKVKLGIGNTAMNLAGLQKAFEEAKAALEIGNIFESESSVFHYSRLGLGRLFFNLPMEHSRIFLDDVFKGASLDFLDNETMSTVRKFLENNLNVSETSRQLFIHRNTLVYRLDKIQKMTGLDLKRFDDAVIFKVSLLVKNYLDKVFKKW